VFVSFFPSSTDVCRSFRGHHGNPKSPSYDVQAHNTSSMTTALASLPTRFVKYRSEQQEEKQPSDMQRYNTFTEHNHLNQNSKLAESLRMDAMDTRRKNLFDLRCPPISKDDCKGPCPEYVFSFYQASLPLEISAMRMFSQSLIAVDA